MVKGKYYQIAPINNKAINTYSNFYPNKKANVHIWYLCHSLELKKKLYTVNNLHNITEIAETTCEGDLCVFQRYTFSLLPENKYCQYDVTFSVAEQFTYLSQNFDF